MFGLWALDARAQPATTDLANTGKTKMLVPSGTESAPTERSRAASDLQLAKGRRRAELRSFDDACAAYVEADREYRRFEVLLELADSCQKAGYPGTAWEALERARALGSPASETLRKAQARWRARARPALVRFDIDPSIDATRLELRLDERILRPSADGAFRVDPQLIGFSSHRVVASLPFHKPREWTFPLRAGDEHAIVIGPLEAAEPIAPPGTAVPPSSPSTSDRTSSASPRPSAPPHAASSVHPSFAFTVLGGRYTLPDGLLPLPAGSGDFAVVTLRPSLSFGALTLSARWSVSSVFQIPSTQPESTFGAPSVGGAYRVPLGRRLTIGLSLFLTPPLKQAPSTDAERVANRLGNYSGGQTFSTRRAAAIPSVQVEADVSPVIVTSTTSLNAGINTDTSEPHILASERVRFAVKALEWLRPYVEGGVTLAVVRSPEHQTDPTGAIAIGGVSLVPTRAVQVSLAYLHPVSGGAAIVDPRMFELSTSLRF